MRERERRESEQKKKFMPKEKWEVINALFERKARSFSSGEVYHFRVCAK